MCNAGVEAVAEKVTSTVSKVADEVGAKVEQLVEIVDDNILDYCTLDKGVRMRPLCQLVNFARGELSLHKRLPSQKRRQCSCS